MKANRFSDRHVDSAENAETLHIDDEMYYLHYATDFIRVYLFGSSDSTRLSCVISNKYCIIDVINHENFSQNLFLTFLFRNFLPISFAEQFD